MGWIKKGIVHGIFEIPNSKHQIPNKSQIPNTNDQNYLDFSTITAPEAFTDCLPSSIFAIF
jgi:hypothetical protein